MPKEKTTKTEKLEYEYVDISTIPAPKRMKPSKYDEIIKKALEAPEGKAVKVSGGMKVYGSLDLRIQKHNKEENRTNDLQLMVSNKELYILKKPKGSVKRQVRQRKKKD